MLCSAAKKRLGDYGWQYSDYSRDQELMEHLDSCPECLSLVRAEELLHHDLGIVREMSPATELSLDTVRATAERGATGQTEPERMVVRSHRASRMRYRLAGVAVAAVVIILSLVPISFTEKVGYEIAIGGVDRAVALDNQKITSLLGALGMEKDKASTLLDSLGRDEIRLSVGECSETCRLTISDLKTERDVRLMVKAIIDLGCCQIDNIAPIFRHESTSLLGLAARKLLS